MTHANVRQMKGETIAGADVLVMFGISGDLGFKKLLPALYQLEATGRLHVPVLGVAGSDWTSADLHARLEESLRAQNIQTDPAVMASLGPKLGYLQGDYNSADTFAHLAAALEKYSNPAIYLAIPPTLFSTVVEGLAGVGLNENSRLVLEKPFGRDLPSAQELNRTVLARFPDERVFRIDHFLGKEPVLNLLVFRFANSILEPLWNRHYISRIELTMSEEFGVEGRGSFYDSVGALRDVVQNHLLQVITLMAMEPPISDSPESLRDEKVKLMRTIRDLDPTTLVRGQYEGYLDETGVDPDSDTETFVATCFHIDNWRWSGVPWFVRAGKAMETTFTEAVIEFAPTPHPLFTETSAPPPNLLRFRLTPDDQISLEMQAKRAGEELWSHTVALDVDPEAHSRLAQPYERLLQDVIEGDPTHFARQDYVEEAWRVVQPVLEKHDPVIGYPKGTWGPVSRMDGLPERWLACGPGAGPN